MKAFTYEELFEIAHRARAEAHILTSGEGAVHLLAIAAHANKLGMSMSAPTVAPRPWGGPEGDEMAPPSDTDPVMVMGGPGPVPTRTAFVGESPGEAPMHEVPSDEEEKVNWLARLVARRRGMKVGAARSAIAAALDGRRLIDLIESGKLAEFLKLLLQLRPLFV